VGGPLIWRDLRAAVVTALVVVAIAVAWTVYVALRTPQHSLAGGAAGQAFGGQEEVCMPRAQHDPRVC
jgi:predicted metal-binding membrane protein